MIDSFQNIVLYIGVADAILIMVFGVVAAALNLFASKDYRDQILDRTFPALACLVGASIAAALVLGGIRWLVS